MVRLQILQCVRDGSDPGNVLDAVSGNGFYMRMDIAISLALSGAVEFVTRAGPYLAKVSVWKSSEGRLYLRTNPDAIVANNLGEIKARRVRPRPVISPPSALGGLGRSQVRGLLSRTR